MHDHAKPFCHIKSYIIHGFTNKKYPTQKTRHAWIKVFINGEWKHMDITWDLASKERRYFLIGDEEFEKTRLWTEDGIYYKSGEEMKEKLYGKK